MNVVLRRIKRGTKDGASKSGNTHKFTDECKNEGLMEVINLSFKLLTIAMISMFAASGRVGATSMKVGSESSCSDEFIGTVKEIKDVGPSLLENENAKVDVTFEVSRTIKGSVGDEVTLKLLKFGPAHFEQGSEYQIQMNHGWFCNSEKL